MLCACRIVVQISGDDISGDSSTKFIEIFNDNSNSFPLDITEVSPGWLNFVQAGWSKCVHMVCVCVSASHRGLLVILRHEIFINTEPKFPLPSSMKFLYHYKHFARVNKICKLSKVVPWFATICTARYRDLGC